MRRIVVTAGCLVLWRLGAAVEIPATALGGHGVERVSSSTSVMAMGLNPFFNAWLILQLIQVVSASAREWIPRNYPRAFTSLTALLAFGQAYGLSVLWQNSAILPAELPWFGRLTVMAAVVGGTMVLVFLSQVVDEHGIGYGHAPFTLYAITSLISALRPLTAATGVGLIADLAAIVGITALTVLAFSSKRQVGRQAIRLRLESVAFPPVFAISIIFFPTIAANFLVAAEPHSSAHAAGAWIAANWTPTGPNHVMSALYLMLYSTLVVAFSLFVAMVSAPARSRRVALAWIRLSVPLGLMLVLVTVAIPSALTFTVGGHVSGSSFVVGTAMLLPAIGQCWRRWYESQHP